MKILIIGGAGYIGSVLVEEFLRKGHHVAILDVFRRGLSQEWSGTVLIHNGFTIYNMDFTHRLFSKLMQETKFDLVIHLAAIVGDKACQEEPELAEIINYEGIKKVVEFCNESNTPLFFASTCSVYGYNDGVCDEIDTEPAPISLYADTKVRAEQYIQEHGKTAIIFRFGTMYGWSPNMRFDLVVNKLVQIAIQSQDFHVFGGNQFRPFIHPLDLAYFFMRLGQEKLTRYYGKIYNLVSENLMMKELGELIERLIPSSRMFIDATKEDERSYICRSFRAYKELGWSPRIRVRDGIQEIERCLQLHTKSLLIHELYNT